MQSVHVLQAYYSNNNYLDPNYLNSDEFIVLKSDIKNLNQNTNETEIAERDSTQIEETNIINNYYEDNSTFDLYYSSRIRRFHRPYYNYGYFGNYYSNYLYSGYPYHYGSLIYYDFAWNSPYYYGTYGYYDPYYDYYSYYYTPYFYNGYHNHHGHFYGWNHTHTVNSNNYIFGHRKNLSSRTRNLSVKPNIINSNNIISNSPKNNIDVKTNSINKSNNTKSNTDFKTNYKNSNKVNNNSKNSLNKSNSTQYTNKRNNNFSKTKNYSNKKTTTKTRSFNNTNRSNQNRSFNNSNSIKNSFPRSKGTGGSRNTKPRK